MSYLGYWFVVMQRFISLNEPSHEIMVLFVLCKLIVCNAYAQPSNGARCLIVGRTLRLLPYFMCANSEGSGETARMRRLARAFAGRLYDKLKYHNLTIWLRCIWVNDPYFMVQ